MNAEIISRSISTKVWDRDGIKLALLSDWHLLPDTLPTALRGLVKRVNSNLLLQEGKVKRDGDRSGENSLQIKKNRTVPGRNPGSEFILANTLAK